MEKALVERLEAAVARLEAVAASGASAARDFGGASASSDPAILAYDDFLAEAFGRLNAAAEKIGGTVLEATSVLAEAFAVAKDLLILAKQYPVLVEYKNKDADHVEWAKALKELYTPGLRDYIKKYYPLGPVWGPAGCAPPKAAAPTPKAPAAKGPPPPAAPSAPLFSTDKSPKSSQPKQGMSAVFQEIGGGKDVTSGLRKVTDDMKAKNRADRSGVVTSSAAAPAPAKTSRAGTFASKTGTPKLELQMGRKWVVENQVGRKDLAIDECDSKQSIYIYGCKDSVLQVNGKVNNITVDKCTKFGIVFKDVVAAFEVVNCNGVEVQCQGTAPTISIDNTAGCQLYLNKESLGASITSAKSSEMNVLVPSDETDGDWVEHPLPQQYIHFFQDGQFTTSPVSHSGA
uniref:Adenylyl cyclase-associated protein n=1 Tax=Aegilops tauschii subsp. strangulata TaxID=200361 RepID=A0A453H941_AEGTS